ncbi:MAG: LacI family transcriptional regulator [Candidatus Dormibacteraeota bacterium]|nr:LacI family transcriptional regulator [Candidatus Dormibacteraeota bacterium]
MRKRFRGGPERGDRVRLSDVAQRAGVSTATASRALNGRGELAEQTRATVFQAAAELDFRPSPLARSLRTRHTSTVGLVVPYTAHSFYASLIKGAQSVLSEAGYRLILIDSGVEAESVAAAIATLLDHEVDGVLVSTSPFGADRFNRLLGTRPCVFLDEIVSGAGNGSVALENAMGVRMLVDHMAWHGHRRIAFVGGPNGNTAGLERLAGFRSAMEEHDFEVSPDLFRSCEWTIRAGFAAALEILAGPSAPTAIVTASAELALGVLAAARSLRLTIPDDVALATFDDRYFAPLLEPSLTAIAYDEVEMGRRGARMLVGAIDEPDAGGQDVRMDVRLVPRRSCGCSRELSADLDEVIG